MPRVRQLVRAGVLSLRRHVSAGLIERQRGIETGKVVDLEDLGLAASDRIRYEPSGWLDLRRALPRREITSDDVFLDLGAGKGRVVIQAARYPFRRVVGVELSPELSNVARQNVAASARRFRCRDVRIVTADVVDYAIPDDVTVIYMYNPFRGETFEHVLQALIASVERAPRRLRVIYRTPLEQESLEATGRFRLMRVANGLRPNRRWAWYRSVRVYELAGPEQAS
jgi:SAM-dependent methyltransferase